MQKVPDVPRVDEDPKGDESQADNRLNEIELRQLDAGAKAKENINREADQRHHFRTWTLVLSSLLIIFMGLVLWHVAHNVLSPRDFEIPSSFIVSMVVAPVISMTTTCIALLVAAFRGYKDSDNKNVASAVLEATRAGSMSNN